MNEFVVVVKTFVHFLGEFEDTKSPFEIIWPLKARLMQTKEAFLAEYFFLHTIAENYLFMVRPIFASFNNNLYNILIWKQIEW